MKGTDYNISWTENLYSVSLGKKIYFKENEFMQCLGTHNENDPFGGEGILQLFWGNILYAATLC